MADRSRRYRLAVTALPFFFLTMSGLARAATITVNTLDSGSPPAPLCSLEDAVLAADTKFPQDGCIAGTGNDTIEFSVTGTITTAAVLEVSDAQLAIIGPTGGITIDGGGGHEMLKADANTTVTLKNLTIADGMIGGPSPFGGAIDEDGANLVIENCTFMGNSAGGMDGAGSGGAIFLNAGTVTIVNSTFANNIAQPGPPVIMGMPTPGAGGAIFNDTGTLRITNSTFSGNQAGHGAVLFALTVGANVAVTSLRGTILANSSGGDNCDTMTATITDDDFNISDDSSCGFSAMNHSLSTTDPLLLPLANNGGPTETFALETTPSTSPAIGLDTDCTDQAMTPNPVLTDQRLLFRPNSPTKCDSGAYEHDASHGIVLVPNTERLQIARSSAPHSDMVNLALSFIEEMANPDCMGEDALNDGLMVKLFEGTCASMTGGPLSLNLSPFVVHTINHQSYGTFFDPIMSETVSARMAALAVPANTCGEWSLNLEVSGLDTIASGLTGGNPFALVLADESNVVSGCFDIDNAIVGNQLPTPRPGGGTRKVRRSR